MNRIKSVDVFRFFAIIGVIAIHTTPFYLPSTDKTGPNFYIAITINQLARFAVPFFFTISGYFWGVKIRNGHALFAISFNMVKKITAIFLIGCFIYLMPYNLSAFFQYGLLGPLKVAYWRTIFFIQHPFILVMQGTRPHLWFLVALLFALCISAVFIQRKWIKSLVFLSLLLYTLGVLAKAYSDTAIGISIPFDTRNGPFFSTLFFVSGYLLSGCISNQRWLKYGLLTLVMGWLVHFSELNLIWKIKGTLYAHEFVFGTYLMGVGAAIAALSDHPLMRIEKFGKIGRMVLGIYVIHYIYVDILSVLDKKISSPFWEVGYIIIVFYLSVQTIKLMSKFSVFKPLFSPADAGPK